MYSTHAHHAHAYASHSSGGWLEHTILSSIIHIAMYHILAPLFKAVGPMGAVVLGLVLIGGVWLFRRSRANAY